MGAPNSSLLLRLFGEFDRSEVPKLLESDGGVSAFELLESDSGMVVLGLLESITPLSSAWPALIKDEVASIFDSSTWPSNLMLLDSLSQSIRKRITSVPQREGGLSHQMSTLSFTHCRE